MDRKVRPAVISVMVSLLVLFGSTAMAGGGRTQDGDLSGGSCPYQEVENVQGSKIRFLEDTYDFGQIPVDRVVWLFPDASVARQTLEEIMKYIEIQGS